MDMGEVGSGSRVMEEEGEVGRGLGTEESLSFGETDVGVNGDVDHEGDGAIGAVGESELSSGEAGSASFEAKVNGEFTWEEKAKGSPTKSVGSPVNNGGSEVVGVSPDTKGKGLRKWRRIKRDTTKDGASEADFGRTLKRGPTTVEPTKSRDENRHKSDGEGESSVASVDIGNLESGSVDIGNLDSGSNDIGNLDSGSIDIGNVESGSHLGSSAATIDPELAELLVSGATFSLGADSDNSEEQSSKSSTAASAPRHKHEGFGFGRERIRAKKFSGRESGHVVQQRGNRGKGGSDASKKIREDCAELRKENSHSSIESDLRSTNAVFVRWGSISSNGKHGEEFVNYDGENSDEVHVSDTLQAGYYKENGRDDEQLSREDLCDDDRSKEGREDENFHSNRDQDPFDESITLLKEAQEALEKELEIFEEIGKTPTSVSDYSSDQSYYEETEVNNSLLLESKLTYLNKKVEYLENELQEASTAVEDREIKVLELEGILNETQLPNNKTEDNDPLLLQNRCREMELELEGLFRRNLEIEIEYLALRKTIKAWTVVVEEHFTLFKEQKSLLEEYDQLVVKLGDAEDEAIILKKKAEELETSCEELVGTDGVLVLQNGVCKSSLCFFLQLVMLCFALWLFFLQLLPHSNEVVPT